jgi:hypothetical protein
MNLTQGMSIWVSSWLDSRKLNVPQIFEWLVSPYILNILLPIVSKDSTLGIIILEKIWLLMYRGIPKNYPDGDLEFSGEPWRKQGLGLTHSAKMIHFCLLMKIWLRIEPSIFGREKVRKIGFKLNGHFNATQKSNNVFSYLILGYYYNLYQQS